MKKQNAFTLAEVLITLGIIGVVAAMTMPTLINKTNGEEHKAAYKKAMSTVSQAVTLNYALDNVDFDTIALTDGQDAITEILTKRMNIASTVLPDGYPTNIEGLPDVSKYVITVDGIMIGFEPNNDGHCGKATRENGQVTEQGDACLGFIDVNGAKGPNKLVGNAGDNPTDIYPVFIEDRGIIPASDAARSVLYDSKTLGDATVYPEGGVSGSAGGSTGGSDPDPTPVEPFPDENPPL